jgi:hypothetical protein
MGNVQVAKVSIEPKLRAVSGEAARTNRQYARKRICRPA